MKTLSYYLSPLPVISLTGPDQIKLIIILRDKIKYPHSVINSLTQQLTDVVGVGRCISWWSQDDDSQVWILIISL